MPFRADLEIKVTETAQLEWKSTVNATFVLDGDADIFDDCFALFTKPAEPRACPSLLL